jgi:hypothetical protein
LNAKIEFIRETEREDEGSEPPYSVTERG